MTRLFALSSLLSLLAGCPARVESEPDAGDAGSDGGSGDGGALACDEVSYDAVLGTARLGTAYRVVDSAVLPVTSWLPVAALDVVLPDAGRGLEVYGYAGDGRVHRLGVWPDLSAPAAGNLLFDAVAPEARALQVMTTPALATTQAKLLAGYRTLRGPDFVDGGVGLFDLVQPDAGTQWLDAPGIESTLGLGSFFLVGSDGLGGAQRGRGVYALDVRGATARPGLVATYPVIANENVRPGLMALTANGVVVLGHYLDGASRHSLRLPEPAQLSAALTGGPTVDLAAAPELTAADDVANLVSFGSGVAVLHTRKVRGTLPALDRLLHYTLTRASGDAGTVVGAPAALLSAEDEGCTAVSQLVPVAGGGTVIVGLWDRNGQRLVRLAPR